jgi:hypothetical protein
MLDHNFFVGQLLVQVGCLVIRIQICSVEAESIGTSIDKSNCPGIEIRATMDWETDASEEVLVEYRLQID